MILICPVLEIRFVFRDWDFGINKTIISPEAIRGGKPAQ